MNPLKSVAQMRRISDGPPDESAMSSERPDLASRTKWESDLSLVRQDLAPGIGVADHSFAIEVFLFTYTFKSIPGKDVWSGVRGGVEKPWIIPHVEDDEPRTESVFNLRHQFFAI